MLTGSGRPRKSCNVCRGQKIRCSGERPACKRCLRLKHACVYANGPPVRNKSKPSQSSTPVVKDRYPSPTPTSPREGRRLTTSNEAAQVGNFSSSTATLPPGCPVEDHYLGIPRSLLLALVDVYFNNVYNASLLLHKRLFLESLAAGTARPHIVLSVCAWGANFYRDKNGQAALKDHGFMVEWAKRAGRLVFQEAEDLHEENIVTFCNLTLFWHSQGSWRVAYLHKGNACQLLHIFGLGSANSRPDNSWESDSLESEIRRRRFWACYLTHAHNSERLLLFEPVADIQNLALPWPEDDFAAGSSKSPRVSLKSVQSNGGVFSELVKLLTLWSSVVFLINHPESSLSSRVTEIHALDGKLEDWWRRLPARLKLTPSNIVAVPEDALPITLLINIFYHQSLCALHASIVPLFSWGIGDDSWSSARQLSAQVAYEHACTVSTLLDAVLSTFTRLSAIPAVVAYAAYCGCAIQIPFMWCLNPVVKERALTNVRVNLKLIHTLSNYFKSAELLGFHARRLYNIHKKHPTILEDEPKNVDVGQLINFKINAPRVRASILDYIGILRTKRGGYVKPGEENNVFGTDDEMAGSASEPRLPSSNNHEDPILTTHRLQNPSQTPNPYSSLTTPRSPNQNEQLQQEQHWQQQQQLQQQPNNVPPLAPHQCQQQPTELIPVENQQIPDVYYPFFDPEMLDLFPNGQVPDLTQFDSSPWSLDHFDTEGWNN